MIFLGDHDIPLTGSNFGNLTAFRAIFNHIFTAHADFRENLPHNAACAGIVLCPIVVFICAP